MMSDKNTQLKDEQFLIHHLTDLANECYNRNYPVYSDFLTLHEQSVFHTVLSKMPPVNISFIGGYDLVERKCISFLPIDFPADSAGLPFSYLLVKPITPRFARPFAHRDVLGSLMGLGIARNKIGDLLVNKKENTCIIICMNQIASYISEQLTQIGHTAVTCEMIATPKGHYTPEIEEITGTVSSIRLDSLCALCMKFSRQTSNRLITEGNVFVNGRCITSNGYHLKENDIISVRHYGKFIYTGESHTTKKGRLFVHLEKYI